MNTVENYYYYHHPQTNLSLLSSPKVSKPLALNCNNYFPFVQIYGRHIDVVMAITLVTAFIIVTIIRINNPLMFNILIRIAIILIVISFVSLSIAVVVYIQFRRQQREVMESSCLSSRQPRCRRGTS